MSEEEILKKLSDSVLAGDAERAASASQEVIAKGFDPVRAIDGGLRKGLEIVGKKWECLEMFLPEVMMSVAAMKAGMEVLRPKIVASKANELRLGTVVIGTVQGDIHDIGKNLVSTMLEIAGFEVHDLKVDVPAMQFVDKAKEAKANIIAMSALMATSMPFFKDVISILRTIGERERYKVMIGGGPVTKLYADQIGADGYGKDADEAVKVAKQLVGK